MEQQIQLSNLTQLIQETLDDAFSESIWVVAEISELKVNQSGHCYLELIEKEDDKIMARVRATIWSWQFRFIRPYFESSTGEQLKEGLKVLVSAKVNFHGVYGLSLNINDIDPKYTLGDLAQKKQEVIDQLKEEGVFDMNKEIPLPDFLKNIAVISSPTAAGYEDFVNQLENNEYGFPFFHRLYPAYMQGNEAAPSIIAALDLIYQEEHQFDAVVIIRGGGAQTDLECFNDYELAVNITQFPLPILTGIGHEKDDTIADMVANTKLKTPTAVAEFIKGLSENALGELELLKNRLVMAYQQLIDEDEVRLHNILVKIKPLVEARIEQQQSKVKVMAMGISGGIKAVIEKNHNLLSTSHEKLTRGLSYKWQVLDDNLLRIQTKISFLGKIRTETELDKLDSFSVKIDQSSEHYLNQKENALNWFEKNIQLVDPKNILKRGYSITLKGGKVVKSSQTLKNGDEIETVLHKGTVKSKVEK